MATEQFTLSFDGDILESGLMDVRELAPALIATGELLQQANRLLNQGRTQLSLQVRSEFRRGSFHIDLVLAQSLLSQAEEFLRLHPQITSAKEILETVFFYAGTSSAAGMGVFKLIKWLRGREVPRDAITFKDNCNVEIRLEEWVELTQNVFVLGTDPTFRRAAQVMLSPLHRDGIERIKISYGALAESVTKEESAYFKSDDVGGDVLLDNTREAVLGIVRLSFNPEHKWSFTDGTTRISARIEDQQFWDDVLSGNVAFAKGDHVRVRIRTRTCRTDIDDLKSDYAIAQVLEHLPRRHPPEQLRIGAGA